MHCPSDYHLGQEGFCYRTEVAVRTQTSTKSDWDQFVGGFSDGPLEFEIATQAFTADHLVEPFRLEAEAAVDSLQASGRRPRGACHILIERWRQILILLRLAADSHVARNDQ